MIIQRVINGESVEIKLTGKELSEANAEFVTNWMTEKVMEMNEDFSDKTAKEIGEAAYEIYCRGNGETEYESVEKAIEEYEEELYGYFQREDADSFLQGELCVQVENQDQLNALYQLVKRTKGNLLYNSEPEYDEEYPYVSFNPGRTCVNNNSISYPFNKEQVKMFKDVVSQDHLNDLDIEEDGLDLD